MRAPSCPYALRPSRWIFAERKLCRTNTIGFGQLSRSSSYNAIDTFCLLDNVLLGNETGRLPDEISKCLNARENRLVPNLITKPDETFERGVGGCNGVGRPIFQTIPLKRW